MERVSQIIPNLFMGGSKASLRLDGPVDLHVVLAPQTIAHKTSKVVSIVFEDDDTWSWRRDKAKFDELREAALDAAEAITKGKSVLITCHMGINRSGLVTALTLCALGYEPRQAVLLIRKWRSSECLGNKAFERCIMETGGGMNVEKRHDR